MCYSLNDSQTCFSSFAQREYETGIIGAIVALSKARMWLLLDIENSKSMCN